MIDTITKGPLERVPGKQNWVDRAGGLPRYIERIAVHLHHEKGMSIGHAIATAVNAVKRMCATGELNWPGTQRANAGSRAQACAAVAQWEAKKKGHKVAKGDGPWSDEDFIDDVLGFPIEKHGRHNQRTHGRRYGPGGRNDPLMGEAFSADQYNVHPSTEQAASELGLDLGRMEQRESMLRIPESIAAENFDYVMESGDYTPAQRYQAAVAYGEHVVRRLNSGQEVSTSELTRLARVYEMMQVGPPEQRQPQAGTMTAYRDPSGRAIGHRVVRKRNYTTEQRREAAKTGHALPDGSFPIYDLADVANAKSLLHHAKDKARAAAHIARWERKLRKDNVEKREFGFEVPITKVDTDQQLVFGWANITVNEDGSALVDKQDDVIDILDLEKAAYDYVVNSRDGSEMHQRRGVSTLVESFVVTPEKLSKIGLAPDAMPSGWWVGFKVHDPDVWDGVKTGKYSMFSIHGTGKRKAV